jgi:hypothetical protein
MTSDFRASVQGVVVKFKIALGSKDSFIYVKSLELDVSIGGVKVSTSGTYVACNLL